MAEITIICETEEYAKELYAFLVALKRGKLEIDVSKPVFRIGRAVTCTAKEREEA